MAAAKRRKSEDEEDKDRPRKKKKKKKPSGLGMMPIVLGGVGALVVLIVIVTLTLWLVLRNRGSDTARPNPDPGGASDKSGKPRSEMATYRDNYQRAKTRLDKALDELYPIGTARKPYPELLSDAQRAHDTARNESANWKVPPGDGPQRHYKLFQEYLTLYNSNLQWKGRVDNRKFGNNPIEPWADRDKFKNVERDLRGSEGSLIE